MSHASHWPVHGALQQTPSAQNPDGHSLASRHGAPFGLAQVPSFPGTLQASSPVQLAVEQHTLSMQLPESQSLAPLHFAPFAPFWHAPAAQPRFRPGAQSLAVVHEVLQVNETGSQANLPQSCTVEALQAPAPSHPASRRAWLGSAQLAAAQIVDAEGNVQAARWAPSQAPAQAPAPVQAARVPTGAPATATQLPAALHASHCPVQGESQQTPSTQPPGVPQTAQSGEWQSAPAAALHAAPRGFLAEQCAAASQ